MNTPGFSTDVDIKRQSMIPYLNHSWQQLFDSPRSRDRMMLYLIEVFHYVSHTCPLMAACAPRVQTRFPALYDYLEKHIREETGHELWVLDDLENLGFNRELVKTSTPLRETISLIGCQMYVIQSDSPEGYLGYIYTMEGNTASISQLDSLCRAMSIEPSHLRAIYLHARIDTEHHIVDLRNWLDSNPMDEWQQQAVIENMERSSLNIADLVEAIARLDDEEIDERLTALGFSTTHQIPETAMTVESVMT